MASSFISLFQYPIVFPVHKEIFYRAILSLYYRNRKALSFPRSACIFRAFVSFLFTLLLPFFDCLNHCRPMGWWQKKTVVHTEVSSPRWFFLSRHHQGCWQKVALWLIRFHRTAAVLHACLIGVKTLQCLLSSVSLFHVVTPIFLQAFFLQFTFLWETAVGYDASVVGQKVFSCLFFCEWWLMIYKQPSRSKKVVTQAKNRAGLVYTSSGFEEDAKAACCE